MLGAYSTSVLVTASIQLNLRPKNILSNIEYLAAIRVTIHLRFVVVRVSNELSKALLVASLNSLISSRSIASLEVRDLLLRLFSITLARGESVT